MHSPAFFSRVARGLFLALFCLPVTLPGETAATGELWDATLLPQPGELQVLHGTWAYQPWSDRDTPPDFSSATSVSIPGHRLPGAYRTSFTASGDPSLARTRLHFPAVGYGATVFVNGTRVGSHLGGYTPFEFDITEALQAGQNELVVLVEGVSSTRLHPERDEVVSSEEAFTVRGQAVAGKGSRSLIGFGYFAHEGIRGGVHVREVPLVRIADTTLTTSFRDQSLVVGLLLANQTDREREVTLELSVFPYSLNTQEAAAEPDWEARRNGLIKPGASESTLTFPWENPRLWRLGDPHLYIARLTLLDARSGETLQVRSLRFGFREIWTEGNRIFLNGVPLRGFVHGTLDTQASPGTVRQLFTSLLDTNINLVRPSTMPPPPHFARIADEMGMGLIGESEWTFNRNYAFEQPAFWKHFQRIWRARIARDKNHPSILIWSLANEVMLTSPGIEGLGENFYEQFLALSRADPTRPFMQEGDGDLRDHTDTGTGFPIDILNFHLYDVSPDKNPLWATEFPPIAWALEDVTDVSKIPGSLRYGRGFPDRDRPWFIGEFGPAVLIAYPDHFAFWTGPESYRDLFGDAAGVMRGVGETMAQQIHAFRDLGMAAMDPWGATPLPGLEPYLKPAMSPVLLFTRDYQAHGFSGATLTRGITLLNDSARTQILHLEARLFDGETTLSRETHDVQLAPGERFDEAWEFSLPRVTEKRFLQWIATASDAEGTIVSEVSQTWSVYPEIRPNRSWRNRSVKLIGPPEALEAIAVWSGTRPSPVSEISRLSPSRHALVLIDFHTFHRLPAQPREQLLKYIREGGVVLVNEADILAYAGLQIESNFLSNSTRLFLQRSHHLTAGTSDDDWEFWWPAHHVSRANYAVPFQHDIEVPLIGSGAGGLRFSPLIVRREGRGAIIASRLQLENAVAREPVARLFLNQASTYGDALKAASADPQRHLTPVRSGEDPSIDTLFETTGATPQRQLETALHSPTGHVLFLEGDDAPTPDALSQLRAFVEAGGILWIHRLSPATPYLETLNRWTGASLTLRPPTFWLQQFEVAAPAHPWLDGINDSHTCWATFAWTHGDRYSLRTTPIADYALQLEGGRADVLLQEPDWIGTWDSGPGKSTLAQELIYKAGTHRPNPSPAAGLIRFPLGDGAILIDQLRWDSAIPGNAVSIPDKARHYLFTLWKNLAETR